MRNNQTTEWTLDSASYSDHAWLMLSLPAKTWKSPQVSSYEGRSALALSFHTFNLKTIHCLTVKMFNCETQKCLNVPTNISSIFHFNNIYIWQWVTETLTVRCVLCVIHYTLTLERGVVQWCKEKRRSVVKTLDKEDWGSSPFWSAQIFGRHSNLSVGRNILASKDILVSRNILVGRDIVNFSAVRSCTEKCWSRQRHQVMFWAG